MRRAGQVEQSTRTLNKLRKLNEAEEIFTISGVTLTCFYIMRCFYRFLTKTLKESIDLIHQGKFNDPNELVQHWQITFEYRQNVLKDSVRDLETILLQWKVLWNSFIGHMLV